MKIQLIGLVIFFSHAAGLYASACFDMPAEVTNIGAEAARTEQGFVLSVEGQASTDPSFGVLGKGTVGFGQILGMEISAIAGFAQRHYDCRNESYVFFWPGLDLKFALNLKRFAIAIAGRGGYTFDASDENMPAFPANPYGGVAILVGFGNPEWFTLIVGGPLPPYVSVVVHFLDLLHVGGAIWPDSSETGLGVSIVARLSAPIFKAEDS